MKKIFQALLIAGISASLVSCSNGDYVVDPSDNANGSVNPITPLTAAEFTWGGTKPFSAEINGSMWVADRANFTLDGSGGNVIVATKDGSPAVMSLYLKDVWSGNLYDMEWKNNIRYATYSDSVENKYETYFSALSNSGGLLMDRNDTAVIAGKFYFKGVSLDQKTVTINKGFFHIEKY